MFLVYTLYKSCECWNLRTNAQNSGKLYIYQIYQDLDMDWCWLYSRAYCPTRSSVLCFFVHRSYQIQVKFKEMCCTYGFVCTLYLNQINLLLMRFLRDRWKKLYIWRDHINEKSPDYINLTSIYTLCIVSRLNSIIVKN